jgi:hypothetical protein
MLTVYIRHSQKCPDNNDIAWRRCRCPKWIQSTSSEDHDSCGPAQRVAGRPAPRAATERTRHQAPSPA